MKKLAVSLWLAYFVLILIAGLVGDFLPDLPETQRAFEVFSVPVGIFAMLVIIFWTEDDA